MARASRSDDQRVAQADGVGGLAAARDVDQPGAQGVAGIGSKGGIMNGDLQARELVLEVGVKIVVERQQLDDLAALDNLAHLGALVGEQREQLGLADQADAKQAPETLLELEEALEVLERRLRQAVRLLDQQQVAVAGGAAGQEQVLELAEARLGGVARRAGGVQGADDGLGDLAALEGLALAVVASMAST